MKSLVFIAFIVFSFVALAQKSASIDSNSHAQALILQPEISPDASTIAFSYQGDIWTVPSEGGRANRLTIHEGYESSPIWNMKNQQIAFNSDRFGNRDVFVVSAKGGVPKRLTYHSAHDSVTSFNGNDEVLFASRRLYTQVEREAEILSVNTSGKRTESRFLDALGFDAVASPDGNKIAFVRGTARTSREDYRGPANRNIWVYDIVADTYTQLTEHAGTDFMPKWKGNNSLYFISPRSGKYNVHLMNLNPKVQITQITNETEFGINHYSLDQNGQNIVYQAGDQIVHFDIATSTKKPLDIDVKSDFRFDPIVNKKVKDNIDQYSVSPNGKFTAYVTRGDIYVKRNDKEDTRSVRLTSGPQRDRDVVWLNDTSLVFVSDKAGQYDLYLLQSADAKQAELFKSLKHKVTAITNTPENESSPVISPDNKKIAYTQVGGKLFTAAISAQGVLSQTVRLLNGWDTPDDVSWSPDSIWLAYSLSDLNFNQEVYIHAADGKQAPVNVSMHPRRDMHPVWSPDGSKLGFSSMRNNGDFDIWFAWLNKKDWQRSKEQWKRASFEDDKASTKKSDKNKNSDKKDAENKDNPLDVTPIEIDIKDIYQRLTQVTRFTGNETELLFDKEGEFVYYSIGGTGRQNYKIDRNLYKIGWDGEDKELVLKGNLEPQYLSLSSDTKHIFALTKGGKLVRIDTKNDKSEKLPVSSQQRIDYALQRAQIFDDAWRALEQGFYDPNFHGKDWNALKEKYRPVALKASTKEDFQYIFNLMLGQLNASHMGMSRGENQKQTQSQKTGLLGLEGKHTDNGFEISAVLANSPAAREQSKLEVGDIITSINQQLLSNTNMYSLLVDQAETPVLIEYVSKGKKQELVIWPTASLRSQTYEAWVDERRRLTDKYSNGRLGYLHIRGMNWSSFERFERDLMAAGYAKDGIVIDVRYNGGGWTTDYLMAVLNVKQHAYTIPRGAAKNLEKEHRMFKDTYPFAERLPLSAWTKPSIAMSNENSYSNAEIFSHAYKALGIGKLVGRPTFGAVISTGGYRLVDGSFVRMPFRGWWEKASGENMEFVPAKPDIEVFNPPAYKTKGVDPQLKRAVEELLKDL